MIYFQSNLTKVRLMKSTEMKGKFIVLYGINNLGKSTQAELLVENLQQQGHDAIYMKYPVYDLEPSGPMINAYLRQGNPHNLSAREAQLIYTLNRTQYEKVLLQQLQEGKIIIAEDYTGTGIAWGVGAGVEKDFLVEVNSHLLKEDIAFLFEGERFTQGIEATHKHEQDNDLTTTVRQAHKELAQDYGWVEIDANREREVIQQELLTHITSIL